MPSRKESRPILEGALREDSLLQRIRNMWQFANLCQWIYIFGKVAKIDESLEIEDLEMECLKPNSTVLDDIGLGLLKLVTSHRGLTNDIFDDQLRKQYLLKSPDSNPLGKDDDTRAFSQLDVCTKIIVLQKLTQWAMAYPERIRDKMEEQKDTDQTSWRIEPYGWDSLDRTYFVLDDNRVYRMTEPPPPPPKTKKRKSYSSGRRSSKRRRTTQPMSDHEEEEDDEAPESVDSTQEGLGGARWECVAISLDEVRQLVDGFRKSRDDNEKVLRRQLDAHLIPILEKQEESRKRKELQRERELLNLAKMANAKRSSRIANKAEQKKEEERVREEEWKVEQEEAARRKEEEQQRKLEKERDSRLLSREKRLKEREVRRRIHEEELAQLSEDSKSGPDGLHRISERRLQAEIERNKLALQELADEEEDWVFDCVCGLYGQIDDGTHSVACERCNIWQHSKCIGVSEREAENTDFHFICRNCRKRMEEASTPRKTIKIKIKTPANHTELSNHAYKTASDQVQHPPAVANVTHCEPNTTETGIQTSPRINGRSGFAQHGQPTMTQNGNSIKAEATGTDSTKRQGGYEAAQKLNSHGIEHTVLQNVSNIPTPTSPYIVKPSPAKNATDAPHNLSSSILGNPSQGSKQDPPIPTAQDNSFNNLPKIPPLKSHTTPSSSSPSLSLSSIKSDHVTGALRPSEASLQPAAIGGIAAVKPEMSSHSSPIPSPTTSALQGQSPATRDSQQMQPPKTLLPPISSLPMPGASQTIHRPPEYSKTSAGQRSAQE